MKYKVVRYWDTHIDKTVKSNIKTLDEAKRIAKAYDKEYYERGKLNYDFYVFNSENVKVT